MQLGSTPATTEVRRPCKQLGINIHSGRGRGQTRQLMKTPSPCRQSKTHSPPIFSQIKTEPVQTIKLDGCRVRGPAWAWRLRAATAARNTRLSRIDDPARGSAGRGRPSACRPRQPIPLQPPGASPTPCRSPPQNLMGGQRVPGGVGIGVSVGLAGGDGGEKGSEKGLIADALTALRQLLEESREEIEAMDTRLRKKLPQPRKKGRKRVNYPPPYLGAAARLYAMGYNYAKVCRAVNTLVGPQHSMNEDTLRNRLVEAGVKLRNPSEAVRMATLKGQRKPPKNTVQKALAAALVQTDAALRTKGKTMLELILNTPHEAYARTIAKIFQEHGTISLGARRYTEKYYEWQLIVRLDLKDWGFLIDCKKSMRVPSFIKTEEELRAYLAMVLACEGHIK